LAEQCGWTLPDAIVYPAGGGTGVIGLWKAFAELEALGRIGPQRPRMIAVQSEGCAPYVRALERGERFAEPWSDAQTAAAGIRVPGSVGDFLVLDAIRESEGAALAVPRRSRMRVASTVPSAHQAASATQAGAYECAASATAPNTGVISSMPAKLTMVPAPTTVATRCSVTSAASVM